MLAGSAVAQADEGYTLAEVEAILGEVRTPGPGEILIGGYLNDVQTIDLVTHSYPADIYIWFRWTDPELSPLETFEFMNFFDPEAHIEDTLYDEPQLMPDGSYYNIIRHQGQFSASMGLGDYPFDRQTLKWIVEDAEFGSEVVNYIADPQGFQINEDISLPGYIIGKPELRIFPKPYDTIFGDINNPETGSYSRALFVLPISRPLQTGLIKFILPVGLILLCAGLALAVHPDHTDARIGLVITALLTLVALQITTNSALPEVGYLMLVDQIYILSYALILITLLRVVTGTWRTEADDDLLASKRDKQILSVLGFVFIALIALLVLMAIL
jgi:hypothetical protein